MIKQLAITLDIYKENTTIYKAKQSDGGSRFLLATITANNVVLTVDADEVTDLKVYKPDGKCTMTAGSVVGGKILVELTTNTLAAPGMAFCFPLIYKIISKLNVGNMPSCT